MRCDEPTEVVAALWETVERDWADDSKHRAFLDACAEEGTLAYAASRYREQKESGAENRKPVAESQLKKIMVLALAQMTANKTPPHRYKRWITVLAAIVSGALILTCVYLMTL